MRNKNVLIDESFKNVKSWDSVSADERSLVLRKIKEMPVNVINLSDELKSSDDVVLEILKAGPMGAATLKFAYAEKGFQFSEDLKIKMFDIDPSVATFVEYSQDFMRDINNAKRFLCAEPFFLYRDSKYPSLKELNDNKEVMQAIIKCLPAMIEKIGPNLAKDKEFLEGFIKEYHNAPNLKGKAETFLDAANEQVTTRGPKRPKP